MKRFWSKVAIDNVHLCWEWQASKKGTGYGSFYWDNRQNYAHRASYEIMFGQIPKGLVIDHLCRNHSCVNPYHLEAVTYSENTKRGEIIPPMGQGGDKHNHLKIHCAHGHPFNEKNTYRHIQTNGSIHRGCRICNQKAVYAYRQRKKNNA